MKLRNILSIIICTFMLQTAFAGQKNASDVPNAPEEKKTQLTEAQQKALQTFHQEMKAFHEKHMKNQENRKKEWHALKEKKKSAFIKGDFESFEKIQDEFQSTMADKKDEHQKAKVDAMKKAFGTLTESDREALVSHVMEKRGGWKDKMEDKREDRKERRKGKHGSK